MQLSVRELLKHLTLPNLQRRTKKMIGGLWTEKGTSGVFHFFLFSVLTSVAAAVDEDPPSDMALATVRTGMEQLSPLRHPPANG